MRTLNQAYLDALNAPSDICEHLETIRKYAQQHKNITEMGVRGGVSTWALLAALPETIACYDIIDVKLDEHREIAAQNGVALKFRKADVLAVDIADTGLLLIDTWHTYAQLTAELARHASAVQPGGHIIMHDTYTYGTADEPPYAHASGISRQWVGLSPFRGLQPAIRQFLATNPGWHIAAEYTHCNGLTVLERCQAW